MRRSCRCCGGRECAAGELVALDVADIDLDGAVVTVAASKTGEVRVLPLHEETVTAFERPERPSAAD